MFKSSIFDNDDFFGSSAFGQRPFAGMGFRSHSFNDQSPFKREKVQDPPIQHDLYATLEEIYSGCTKKMKISRKIMQPDGEFLSFFFSHRFLRPKIKGLEIFF